MGSGRAAVSLIVMHGETVPQPDSGRSAIWLTQLLGKSVPMRRFYLGLPWGVRGGWEIPPQGARGGDRNGTTYAHLVLRVIRISPILSYYRTAEVRLC